MRLSSILGRGGHIYGILWHISINELIDVKGHRRRTTARPNRPELELDLDETRLRKLTKAREERLVGTLPE